MDHVSQNNSLYVNCTPDITSSAYFNSGPEMLNTHTKYQVPVSISMNQFNPNVHAELKKKLESRGQIESEADEKQPSIKEFKSSQCIYTYTKYPKVPLIDEAQAKEALRRYAGQKCLRSKKAVDELDILNMESSNTFIYALMTFVESREAQVVSEPYNLKKNGPIQESDHHLDIWKPIVKPNEWFQDQEQKIKMPFTTHIKKCDFCLGTGSSICTVCHGKGSIKDKKCTKCDSKVRTLCETCNGFGHKKHSIEVIVKFKNYKKVYFANSVHQLPENFIERCASSNIFSNEDERVFPIRSDYYDEEIRQASIDFHVEHATKFSNHKILKQKHYINSVPVTECKYRFNSKNFYFYVFGTDCQVWAKEYPNCGLNECCSCCCGVCLKACSVC